MIWGDELLGDVAIARAMTRSWGPRMLVFLMALRTFAGSPRRAGDYSRYSAYPARFGAPCVKFEGCLDRGSRPGFTRARSSGLYDLAMTQERERRTRRM